MIFNTFLTAALLATASAAVIHDAPSVPTAAAVLSNPSYGTPAVSYAAPIKTHAKCRTRRKSTAYYNSALTKTQGKVSVYATPEPSRATPVIAVAPAITVAPVYAPEEPDAHVVGDAIADNVATDYPSEPPAQASSPGGPFTPADAPAKIPAAGSNPPYSPSSSQSSCLAIQDILDNYKSVYPRTQSGYVRMLNDIRSRIAGVCKVDVQEMVWDPKAVSIAESSTSQRTNCHISDGPEDGEGGTNHFMWSLTFHDICQDPNILLRSNWGSYGHLSALLWGSANAVGVASKHCGPDGVLEIMKVLPHANIFGWGIVHIDGYQN
ncbi:hypothetical protein HK101_000883 [Irineochytrium annulatum]|nr:hypothetical protein HK101_000883 [Irineochytrium annulatum]